MAGRRITASRVRKALLHRRSIARNRLGRMLPGRRRRFQSATELRAFALSASGQVQRCRYIIGVPAPVRAVDGLRLALPHIASCTMQTSGDQLSIELTLAEPLPEGQVAWAVAQLLTPSLAPHASGGADVLIEGASESANAAAVAGRRLQFGSFTGSSDAVALERQHALSITAAGAGRSGFDPFAFNPVGLSIREQWGALKSCDVEVVGGARIKIDGREFLMDEHAAAELKRHSSVLLTCGPGASGEVIAAVAATGVVVRAESAPEGLDSQLAALVTQPLPPQANSSDLVRWLQRSCVQRRLALLHHAAPWTVSTTWPRVSVLLASNRPSRVAEAVEGVLAQTYPELDLHVILHGIDDHALADSLRARDPRITTHRADSSRTLGEVYAEVTGQVSGQYIAKMDDDDLYSPHHLWDCVLAARYSGAGLIGRVPAMTWLEGSGELLLRSFGPEERFGAYVAGAAMLIDRGTLLRVGGWRPTPWAEDKALIDRFQSAGFGTYRTGQMDWMAVRHQDGHTWLRDEEHFRATADAAWSGDEAQQLRELVLSI